MPQFKQGDVVHVPASQSAKWAGTYLVVKVNPTTYGLEGIGDDKRRLRAAHEFVQEGPAPERPSGLTRVEVTDLTIEHKFFETGAVVSVDLPKLRGHLWVVTGQTARGYRVFPLGGSMRYFTNIPVDKMTEVTEITDWKKGQ